MGTHPSNPSKDVENGTSLLELIQQNPSLMTKEVATKYNNKLPFLFKVLSIGKALSIQAHPNKKLAEQLHSKDPKNYPDDNHKPEMTIAITPFTGLCGFRPLKEISHFLEFVPALARLVGKDQIKAFVDGIKDKDESESDSDVKSNKKLLQETFTKLMKSSKEDIESATKDLMEETKKAAEFAGGIPEAEEIAKLVPELNSQFPNDIGLFVMFFLNYVKLNPGEAMFLKADDIHAYISGDVIECMAASDNVIRAGFTPKFKDVDTLTSILTYDYAPPEKQKLTPEPYPYSTLNVAAYKSGSSCDLYDPPIEEFSVVRTALCDKGKATIDPMTGPSIIICTDGNGKIGVGKQTEEMKTGYVYFVPASARLVLEGDGMEEFVTFQAFCELGH
jgi:mannose-6-phosphate isomerase